MKLYTVGNPKTYDSNDGPGMKLPGGIVYESIEAAEAQLREHEGLPLYWFTEYDQEVFGGPHYRPGAVYELLPEENFSWERDTEWDPAYPQVKDRILKVSARVGKKVSADFQRKLAPPA